MTYPVPSYAAHLWVVGDQIKLGLPPLEQNQQSHTVSMPFTIAGMQALLMILRDRERQRVRQTVGTKAAPTQYNVEEMLKLMKKAPKKPKVEAASVADCLELEISTEDLKAELKRRTG